MCVVLQRVGVEIVIVEESGEYCMDVCGFIQRVGVEIVIVEESGEYCMDVCGLTACWCGDSDSGGVRGVLYGCMWSHSMLVWR